jgi:hypothetical protein
MSWTRSATLPPYPATLSFKSGPSAGPFVETSRDGSLYAIGSKERPVCSAGLDALLPLPSVELALLADLLRGVPGRLRVVRGPAGISVIVATCINIDRPLPI